MKSQAHRFLRCIPAVRSGLRRHPHTSHDPDVFVSGHSGDERAESSAPTMKPSSVTGESVVQTVRPFAHIPDTAPEEVRAPEPNNSAAELRQRMTVAEAKVIVLEYARAASQPRRPGQGKAKGPAAIIPFPQRDRPPRGCAPLESQAPQEVAGQHAASLRAVPEAAAGHPELSSSRPRTPQDGGPADMPACSTCAATERQYLLTEPLVFGMRSAVQQEMRTEWEEPVTCGRNLGHHHKLEGWLASLGPTKSDHCKKRLDMGSQGDYHMQMRSDSDKPPEQEKKNHPTKDPPTPCHSRRAEEGNISSHSRGAPSDGADSVARDKHRDGVPELGGVGTGRTRPATGYIEKSPALRWDTASSLPYPLHPMWESG